MRPFDPPRWNDFGVLNTETAEVINWEQTVGGASFVYVVRPELNRTTGEPSPISPRLLERMCCIYAVNLIPDAGLNDLSEAIGRIYLNYTPEDQVDEPSEALDTASVGAFNAFLVGPRQ
jgi:hypothetical protein